MHLRQIGSRFVVVTTTLPLEAGDSAEGVRQAGHPKFYIEELNEHEA